MKRTWNWIGGWCVDMHDDMPYDDAGWSCSHALKHLTIHNTSTCHDAPFDKSENDASNAQNNKTIQYPFRIRRWVRLRVLVLYSSMGEKTKLFNLGGTKRWASGVHLHNQLLHTRMKLWNVKNLKFQVSALQQTLQDKDRQIWCKHVHPAAYCERVTHILTRSETLRFCPSRIMAGHCRPAITIEFKLKTK